MEERKRNEGHEHLQKAEKYLETSYMKLKFSPDWDSAANEFNKAAVCFKVSKNWDLCKAARLRGCEAYANSGGLFHAAKQLEEALLICKEEKNMTEVVSLAERAGLLYRQAGSPEAASQLLVKSAKMLEMDQPEQALGLYQKASETVGVEDRPVEAAQHLEAAARLMVRLAKYNTAAETLHTSLGLYSDAGTSCGRLVVALVLVQVAREDTVAAGKVWSQWGGLCDSSQSGAVNDILNGFNENDGEMARRGLSSPTVMHMDNVYARLARDIVVPEDGEDDLC